MALTEQAALRKDRTNANSTMEHRHFATVAAIIAGMPSFSASLRTQKRSCALAFADGLARTNPRFDRKRFLTACNVED